VDFRPCPGNTDNVDVGGDDGSNGYLIVMVVMIPTIYYLCS